MSLQEVLKGYEYKKRHRQKTLQHLRQQLEKNIEDASIQALKLQNHKVNHIHKNQQAIEAKMRSQQELLADFRRNEEVWASLYDQLNRALMQVGDLVHYAGYVEAEIGEMVGLGSVAKYLEEAQNEPAAAQEMKKLTEAAQTENEASEDAKMYEQIVEQGEKFDSVI